mmetsp:Transcript_9294/g.9375  ORF Transcript_9294/g.9375 Transcript_9294/m.9375 type:complete len:83 (+) Transcript_9294:897-1145(+)
MMMSWSASEPFNLDLSLKILFSQLPNRKDLPDVTVAPALRTLAERLFCRETELPSGFLRDRARDNTVFIRPLCLAVKDFLGR